MFFAAMAMTAICVQAQEIAATGDAYMAAQLAAEDLNGTARYVGMGGAMDALGADISTIGSNPAGIGLFRKSSLSGSFGAVIQSDGKTFADGSKTSASFDQLGFVISNRLDKQSFVNFGFNYHKNRNFNYVLSAVNSLNGSSQNSQTIVKGLSGRLDGLGCTQLDDLLLYNLCNKDVVTDGDGNTSVIEPRDANGNPIFSDYGFDAYTFDRAHTGYISEYDFNISGNIKNRVYLGLTLGLQGVHYKGYSEYYEYLDAMNPARNYFRDVLISDNYSITGTGYNVKAGIIFRPFEESPFRIGAAVHTPTFYKLTAENYTTIGTDVDNSHASEDFKFNTPWKFNVSAGTTIGTQLALGFTYEYSDFSTCDMRTIDGYRYDYEWGTEYATSSSEPVMKREIEKSLKGVSTLKVGAEFKPDKNVALRAGYNYVTAAYKTDAVRDQTVSSPGVYYASTTDYTNWGDTHRLTAGVGFTFDKLRLDLAYQYQTRKGDFYPFMKYLSASYGATDDLGKLTGEVLYIENGCTPVKVKDNRHQLLATLTYTF
jgi:opacity protein-like surface antigen